MPIRLNGFDNNWENPQTVDTVDWTQLTYGNGKFIALTNVSYCTVSSDGINWTSKFNLGMNNTYSICYGDGKFIACGTPNSLTNGQIKTSTDGLTWGNIIEIGILYPRVCYGNGKYIIVGKNNLVSYSTDGENWSNPVQLNNSNPDITWAGVIYGGNKFVAYGDYFTNYTHNLYVAMSSDGVNWSANSSLIGSSVSEFYRIAYGNNAFVISSYKYLYTSLDGGSNWTSSTTTTNHTWKGLAYGDGYFVAADINGYISISTDGLNWSEAQRPFTGYWHSATYGDGRFVLGGQLTASPSTGGFLVSSMAKKIYCFVTKKNNTIKKYILTTKKNGIIKRYI